MKYLALLIILCITATEISSEMECPDSEGEFSVFFRHETDCDKYYQCANGTPVLKECPEGLVFNDKEDVNVRWTVYWEFSRKFLKILHIFRRVTGLGTLIVPLRIKSNVEDVGQRMLILLL